MRCCLAAIGSAGFTIKQKKEQKAEGKAHSSSSSRCCLATIGSASNMIIQPKINLAHRSRMP